MSQIENFHDHADDPRGPGALAWILQQFGWYLRKLVLWPIADSFRWFGRGIARFFGSFRYRSPFAYIGATLAVTVTAGAVAAAVYFYKQSENPATPNPAAPALAGSPAVTVPAQIPAATPAPVTAPAPVPQEDTLSGVVPNFRTSAARSGNTSGKTAAKTIVKPQPAPASGPLRVAHRFASAFVGYEVGEKKANRGIDRTASSKLARDLRANPPKLPAAGNVPKAAVMNVVKGKAGRNRLAVSVALKRAGVASELRLALVRTPHNGWLVSEVRG